MKLWWKPRQPHEIVAFPWLHEDVIQYLSEIVRLDMRVIEQGAGGSTLWFAERARSVLSFEHNPYWAKAVQDKAPHNCQVIHWPQANVFPAIPYKCDLAFIDGEHKTGGRGQWLLNIRPYIKPGGWLVLDNANRPEYAGERETLSKWAELVKRFDANEGGSRFFVTEFWRVSNGKQPPSMA